MKAKTLIGIALLAGAGALAWMYWRARTAGAIVQAGPYESGFDYSSVVTTAKATYGGSEPLPDYVTMKVPYVLQG